MRTMVLLSVIIAILFILFLICLLRLLFLKGQIKEMAKSVDYITKNDTNILLTTSVNNRELIALGEKINENLVSMNELKKKMAFEENKLIDTITNLSHDLRTPITSIQGYTALLKNANLTEDEKRYLEIIESRVIALREIIEELYQYSLACEEREFNLETVDLKKVLEEILLAYYDSFTSKGFDVTIDLGEEPILKIVDTFEMKRVFTNIIGNVLKYGNTSFSVSYHENEFRFTNETAELDLIDIEHLFDRFFTVAKARTNGSTGLGLSISKSIVEKMNGSLKASLDGNKLSIILKI